MFFFPEQSRSGYFLLPESLVGKDSDYGPQPALWSRLSSSARAVLLVLASHTNRQGISFPSEETIGGEAGLSRKTVRRALKELEQQSILEITNYISREGRRANKFRWLLSKKTSSSMRFYHTMIDCGIWRRLIPSAKSLYLAFRYFGRAKPEFDPDFDGSEKEYGNWLVDDGDCRGGGEEWNQYLQNRKWDYCKAEPLILCRFAGVSRKYFKEALASLVEVELVTEVPNNREYWQVAIRPPLVWDVSSLNQELREKGGVQ